MGIFFTYQNYLLQARMAVERITVLVRDAMVDCKRDQLWTRLLTNSPPLSFQVTEAHTQQFF